MRFLLNQKIITNPYGRATKWYKFHQGCDYRAKYTPVYAPLDGIITRKWNSMFGGLSLEIKLKDGYKIIMMHLSDIINRKEAKFKEGEKLCYTGNTGIWTTGPHLHVEVYNPKNERIDPEKYFIKNDKKKPMTMYEKVIELFRKKHTEDEAAIAFVPDDDGRVYLLKGGERREVKTVEKVIEALLAIHAIGITKKNIVEVKEGKPL